MRRVLTIRLTTLFAATSICAVVLISWRDYGAFELPIVFAGSLLVIVFGMLKWPPIPALAPQVACLLLAVMFLFVLSIGPATWLVSRQLFSQHQVQLRGGYDVVYRPVAKCFNYLPKSFEGVVRCYINYWLPTGTAVSADWPEELRLTSTSPAGSLTINFPDKFRWVGR